MDFSRSFYSPIDQAADVHVMGAAETRILKSAVNLLRSSAQA